ncbi:MAG TPA: STAS/SEC14 domain-containing protein [Pyrinomonadaceae bacterium]|nr:STAS/SEC14 domain-containing protein [Pyrinomonadaceae bacterium]
MIEILESPKHLVAMKISGKITAEDIEKAYKASAEALKESERVSFFAEVTDSLAFTAEGLLKDLTEAVKHLGDMSKYYRAAIVTDKGWLGALVRVEGLVFSSIDLRVFEPAERNKAFAWASETPEPLPKPEEPGASIHFLQTTNPNVFAYEVNGRVRTKDVKAVVNEFKPYLERGEKVNVLAKLSDFNGFDLFAMLEDDLVKLKFKSLSKVDKYAVIGPKPWMRNLLELFYPWTNVKLRVFDKDEDADAWEWVGAQQALLAGK